MNVQQVYEFLNREYPVELAMSYDNSGFLIGDIKTEVTGILLCLDITKPVIAEAKKLGCNLLLSHHPVIFHPLKQIYSGSLPYMLVSEGLNVISMHTNLDIAKGGANDTLASSLGLKEVQAITFSGEENPLVRVGKVEKTNLFDFAKTVKEKLNCQYIKTTAFEKEIETVAVCGGAGNDYIYNLINTEVDLFVTAQIKHEAFLYAAENNLALIDAGHFETEVIVLPTLQKELQKQFQGIPLFISKEEKNPVRFI